MKIITSAGYYGTGSSAVIDYLREFRNISQAGDGEYEVRFLQDPDGISDLAYHVLEDNHRHNTSHAIKRFIKYVKFINGDIFRKGYRRCFGDQFLPISMKYVDDITQLKSRTWWHYDQIERGGLFYLFDVSYGKLFKRLKLGIRSSFLRGHEMGYYTAIDEEQFYALTRDYLDELFEQAKKRDAEYIIAEQLIPPSNCIRYLKFFNDLKAVVVERDPRDVYLTALEVYNEGVIPVHNAAEFCEWWKITRKHRETEKTDPRVLYVQFEDLVYHYDEETARLREFLGLSEADHVERRKYFDPDVSIKGTRRYINNERYAADIAVIEDRLSKYLYDDYSI